MKTLCEIAGIDGEVWSLDQDGDDQYLSYVADCDSIGPRLMMRVDEYVLEAMWRASLNASVVVCNPVVVDFPLARRGS